MNGDGRPDLLVANSGSNNVSVLLNTTAPGAAAPSFAAGHQLRRGDQPALRGGGGRERRWPPRPARRQQRLQQRVGAAEHDGAGAAAPSFAAATNFAAGSGPVSVAAADVNGDGRPDLLVANSSSSNVSVLLNAGCILGDINCDGIVDIRDYGIWRQDFGQTDCGNPADLDGNCIVDIRDYGIWRANFGHTAGAAALDDASPVLLLPGTATPTPPRTAVAAAAPLATATPTPLPARSSPAR